MYITYDSVSIPTPVDGPHGQLANQYVITSTVSTVAGNEWHALVDCEDGVVIPSHISCGMNAETPCCHLQHVLDRIHEADIVYLRQVSIAKDSKCNQTTVIQSRVHKSFTLKTYQPRPTVDPDSNEVIHGLHMVFNNKCSGHCSITISGVRFSCSYITFNNLDIWIKDSVLLNSFITATGQHPDMIPWAGHRIQIQDTEFHSDTLIGNGKDISFVNPGPCKQLNHVCVSGDWNVVELFRTTLKGGIEGHVSGVEISQANVQTLKLVGCYISLMFSVLVISSSSDLGIVNLTDSIFIRNRDGIDLGQRVRYVAVIRVEMNNTGPWVIHDEFREHCSSAIRGYVQTVLIKDSLFAHNRALGKYCGGVALSLRSRFNPQTPLELENRYILAPTIEISRSKFYGNVVDNCSMEKSWHIFAEEHLVNGSAGAVHVSGSQIFIKVVDSTFQKNRACKGAGLYIGLSESYFNFPAYGWLHVQILSSTIVIDSCRFSENSADYGAGLMHEFTDLTLGNQTNLTAIISNSSFNANLAFVSGAGAHLHFVNVSLNLHDCIFIRLHDNVFSNNSCNEKHNFYVSGGGGLCLNVTSIDVTVGSLIRFEIDYCTFIFNKVGTLGGGMYITIYEASLQSNSSMRLGIHHTFFDLNEAVCGGGLRLKFEETTVVESALYFEVCRSKFTSNIGTTIGGGFATLVDLCSFYSNSSFTFRTTHSDFTSNVAGYRAGVGTVEVTASFFTHSSYTLLLFTDSTFNSNEVENVGTTIDLACSDFGLRNGSKLIQQISNCTFLDNKGIKGIGTLIIRVLDFGSDSNTLIQTTITNFVFSDNMVQRDGAGLAFTQVVEDQYDMGEIFTWCVSGEIVLIVTNTLFKNCATTRKGGALYLQVISNTKVYIISSEFIGNKALSGSAIYLIGDMQLTSCSTSIQNIDTNVLPPTSVLVKESIFNENINTAVLVKSRKRQNLLVLEKCTFRNNWSDKSLYGEDIFTEMSLKIVKTEIWKTAGELRGTSINAQSDVELDEVSITNVGMVPQKQIRNAFLSHYIGPYSNASFNYICPASYKPEVSFTGLTTDQDVPLVSIRCWKCNYYRDTYQTCYDNAPFFHYLSLTNKDSLNLTCPAFYQPKVSVAGLTEKGASLVSLMCEACSNAYYMGKHSLVIQAKDDRNQTCFTHELTNKYGGLIGYNNFCHTNAPGTCVECPHGANCSAGVVALPNYWGHMTTSGGLEFHRCPVGYCCNLAPCKGIAQCTIHREGILCARCIKGFSESLITSGCIADELCIDWWVVPLFYLWTLVLTMCLIFSQDILQIKEKVMRCSEKCKSTRENVGKASPDDSEIKRTDSIEIHTEKHLASKSDSRQMELKRRHSIGTPPAQHNISTNNPDISKPKGKQSIKIQTSGSPMKEQILGRLLIMHRGDNFEAAGGHKYLQILLYYLQDASLLQVDLALASTVLTPIQKFRRLLLNVSQLAVDLIDFGLNLCPFPGWTPVSKLLKKNLTGPFVFGNMVVIYGITRVICFCSPSKRKSITVTWYPRLTAATIFSMLLFYQQIANVTFSLLYCIKSGDLQILFIDGTVTCYQPWQILVFIFAFNWVVGIIPVLVFLPGLLELRLISISEFFLACMMPVPMLLYWLIGFYGKKLKAPTSAGYVTPWHEEALRILQKTFVKTVDKRGLPFCWIGFIKVRRLALVILFTFVSNLVARVSLMCFVIVIFLLFHLETKPYQDDVANRVYTASLLATLAIAILNIMKASCVEFYLDLDKVAHYLTSLDMITDSILVYCPLGFILLTVCAFITGKLRAFVQRKRAKHN